jgi:hypothetical protein
MSRAGRARVARSLREAAALRRHAARAPAGVGRWRLVAACLIVAVVTHLVTRWTVERRPSGPATPAAIAPVSVSMEARLFPTRHQTRIRAWRHAPPAQEDPR